MSTKTFKSPEELRKAWETRNAKIQAQMPQTFKQFCAQCQQTSVMYLNLLVYGSAKKNARTGNLKRREQLIMHNRFRYEILNDAKDGAGFPYAVAQHYGRKAMTSPTPGGRLAYAWLTNRAKKRPAPDDAKAWRELVKKGLAVVAPDVREMPPKLWREKMLDQMRGKFLGIWEKAVMGILNE